MTLAYQEYYTVKDYSDWDGEWELIEGMPYAMSPSPSVTHQALSTNIVTSLKNSLDAQSNTEQCDDCIVLMETDWQISNDTVVRPDAMVICKEVGEKVLVTPDLIVEVVSTSSTKRDEQMKFELYQKEGVLFYILVYPKKQLAKAYINRTGAFSKFGDFSIETIEFESNGCVLSLNFGSVWRV